jgi:hypothetical protein
MLTRLRCECCDRELEPTKTGRPKHFCSSRCRTAASRVSLHEGSQKTLGLGNAQWLARCGDQCCGPTTFANAKAAAIAMSAAGACGDYTVKRPIAHLNGLQVRMDDIASQKEPSGTPGQGI